MDDASFVSWAMTNNESQLDLIRQGKNLGTDAEIRSYSATMEADRSRIGQELVNYAGSKSINVDMDDAKDANQEINDNIDDLEDQTRGAEWDMKWVNLIVDMYEDEIADYKDGGEEADDQALKDWISKNIPTLQSHLDKLRAIKDRLDG